MEASGFPYLSVVLPNDQVTNQGIACVLGATEAAYPIPLFIGCGAHECVKLICVQHRTLSE